MNAYKLVELEVSNSMILFSTKAFHHESRSAAIDLKLLNFTSQSYKAKKLPVFFVSDAQLLSNLLHLVFGQLVSNVQIFVG